MLANAGRYAVAIFRLRRPNRELMVKQGVALERHQHFVLAHLLVIGNVVEDATTPIPGRCRQGSFAIGEALVAKIFISSKILSVFQRPRMSVASGGKGRADGERAIFLPPLRRRSRFQQAREHGPLRSSLSSERISQRRSRRTVGLSPRSRRSARASRGRPRRICAAELGLGKHPNGQLPLAIRFELSCDLGGACRACRARWTIAPTAPWRRVVAHAGDRAAPAVVLVIPAYQIHQARTRTQ